MLRAGLCVAVCVWSGMPASAEPPLPAPVSNTGEMPDRGFRHPIDLSAPFHDAMRPQSRDDRAVLSSHDAENDSATAAQGLSLGPFHVGGFEGSDGMGRKHRRFASFRVDGVTIFGGSVAGNVDGRSANIVLSWPASP